MLTSKGLNCGGTTGLARTDCSFAAARNPSAAAATTGSFSRSYTADCCSPSLHLI